MKIKLLSALTMLILSSCNIATQAQKNVSQKSITMSAMLNTHNVTHKLYEPNEVEEAPHPFYSDMANAPIYSFEDACGVGAFLFDPETNELFFAISYSKLSGTPVMMHFHLGEQGKGGPIIQTIFGEPFQTVKGLGYSPEPPLSGKKGPEGRAGFIRGVYKLKGNSALTPPLSIEEEREKLMNGGIYVNVHTYLNENGEIRGQIYPCTSD